MRPEGEAEGEAEGGVASRSAMGRLSDTSSANGCDSCWALGACDYDSLAVLSPLFQIAFFASAPSDGAGVPRE